MERMQNKWLLSLSVSPVTCRRQRGVCPDLRMRASCQTQESRPDLQGWVTLAFYLISLKFCFLV